MRRHLVLVVGLVSLSLVAPAAQAPVTTPAVPGDRTTPLRALGGDGNVGISNAVLRDQSDVRALRVVVEPGGTRAMHAHDDVKFHLFVPVTGTMTLTMDGAAAVVVPAWQPYYMKMGTRHGFHNPSSTPVEIMEIFIK